MSLKNCRSVTYTVCHVFIPMMYKYFTITTVGYSLVAYITDLFVISLVIREEHGIRRGSAVTLPVYPYRPAKRAKLQGRNFGTTPMFLYLLTGKSRCSSLN